MLKRLKRILSALLIVLFVTVHLSFTSPEPAFASNFINLELPKNIEKILSNRYLIEDAKKFANMTPGKFCKAYLDSVQGIDNSTWASIQEGVSSAFVITKAITSASAAGAGSLTGYAGIASAVSNLGLGGLTTTIASMMGSNAVGAAATAVVTSAVGGPVVMGALIAGGTTATAYGTYKLGEFSLKKLGNWASTYCTVQSSL